MPVRAKIEATAADETVEAETPLPETGEAISANQLQMALIATFLDGMTADPPVDEGME